MIFRHALLAAFSCALAYGSAAAGYTNFEASHVHPLALTPDGNRLLVVNTPDALLEVFAVGTDGGLSLERAVPVGLEPVSVAARTSSEAWVVNHLSDSISVVDLVSGRTTRTLATGDEPTDVVFAAGKAFVTSATEDAVLVYALSNLDALPLRVELFGREPRALAVSNDGSRVYAVVLNSGNRTAIVGNHAIFPQRVGLSHDQARLDAMGLGGAFCSGPKPPYPPLPAGITRNPDLTYPANGVPRVGLIVRWDEGTGRFVDDDGQDWTGCVSYRLPDHDLFAIDSTTLAVTTVDHLGTSLFEVSVNPASGKIYVPHTDARNQIRFEHALGLNAHLVDNRMAIVDPSQGNSVLTVDLNAHINRSSNPATNLAERQASISQPGMLVWKQDGTKGYLTALGSRRVFEVDGACTSPGCIVGSNRAAPRSVEVGHGPSGVALLESKDRLYVLTRVDHSVSIVQASTLQKVGEIVLHDPSDPATREGRQFLYDAVDLSGHGDSSCASCHISGDTDGLAWDLGNPEGEMVYYGTPLDNVRFVDQVGGEPVPCTLEECTYLYGFDPQKGPLRTQTLRSMLEPLHWRGDRATFRDFNGAFVSLMGSFNRGTAGSPAGLSPAQMELFRDFALAIRMPPNPNRRVDDTLPCGRRSTDPGCEVQHAGMSLPGNPTEGRFLFENHPSDNGQPCTSCHGSVFGTAGGKLGGVEPTTPTSLDATALFTGEFNASPHSDLEIAQLRNLYEKVGPPMKTGGDPGPPPAKSAYGYLHQGNMPDLYHYLSDNIFDLSAANGASQVRDIVAFLFSFPTDQKPSVGRQLTVPQGAAPTGAPDQEALLAALITVGDSADSLRHCELVATGPDAGRLRSYHLRGGGWITDVAGEPARTTAQLREGAQGEITFLCAPVGSGPRLGGDRDEDGILNGDDCAPDDPGSSGEPTVIDDLTLSTGASTLLQWTPEVSLGYDVLGGDVTEIAVNGVTTGICLEGDLSVGVYSDDRPDPLPGEGYYYLIRATNPCGSQVGSNRDPLESVTCSP